MKIASVADVKSHFSAYLRESRSGPVVVTRNGRPVAVLLGVTDEDESEHILPGAVIESSLPDVHLRGEGVPAGLLHEGDLLTGQANRIAAVVLQTL